MEHQTPRQFTETFDNPYPTSQPGKRRARRKGQTVKIPSFKTPKQPRAPFQFRPVINPEQSNHRLAGIADRPEVIAKGLELFTLERIIDRFRNRTRQALFALDRSQAYQDLLGCTPWELRRHLESQFTNGMSWDNLGKWHIDHIRPCCSFDLSDPAQQASCFHYTNLQPLWAIDNLSKNGSWTPTETHRTVQQKQPQKSKAGLIPLWADFIYRQGQTVITRKYRESSLLSQFITVPT